MDIQRKYVDIYVDMNEKFHIHSNLFSIGPLKISLIHFLRCNKLTRFCSSELLNCTKAYLKV